MKILRYALIFTFLLSSNSFSDEPRFVQITENDFLELMIGNYVHGFNEFETQVQVTDKEVIIEVYYDLHTQSKARAISFKKRIKIFIRAMLSSYSWEKRNKVRIEIHGIDRTGYGY